VDDQAVGEQGVPSLEEVCRAVERLTGATPVLPQRLRLQYADAMVELNWSTEPEAVAARSANAEPAAGGPADTTHQLRSPMVGTFYPAPGPGQPPFVQVGDLVEPGQQVGIVESMKLMNPIEADVAGRVLAVLVADAEFVEHDQSLLVIEANPS
jgi:acetyl-CoA carboxylase biotin carboxyl carrier protein